MYRIEDIDRWIREGEEGHHLEFKEAKNQIDFSKLCKYCVALANEGGGHLVLGVTDSPPRHIVGTQACRSPRKTEKKLLETLKFRVDVEEVSHSDGRVVVLTTPGRPSGTAYEYEGAYWMRSGEALVPMSPDRLRNIFAEGCPDWLEEYSLTRLHGEDVVALLDTQGYFELLKQPYPTDRAAVLDRLCSDRLIDPHGDAYAVRRLAALLLAKRLDAFPDLCRKATRVVVYDGNSKLNTRLDQTGQKGYAVGFQGLVDFVMSQLPQNEVIEGALRKEMKLLPEVAVRELIANALVHQDFSAYGMSPMIEIYAQRIEISNPGEPIVQVERFIDGYQSRNERLANMMRRLRICEEKGSGVDRVVDAAEMFQLPAPDFRSASGRTSVVVFGPKPFRKMDRNDRVRACYQHCALKWVMSEKMTNQSLRERFKLPVKRAAIVSQIISATMECGLIKLDESVGGSRKYARYLPFWA